jgi:hypothetical protein
MDKFNNVLSDDVAWIWITLPAYLSWENYQKWDQQKPLIPDSGWEDNNNPKNQILQPPEDPLEKMDIKESSYNYEYKSYRNMVVEELSNNSKED